MHTAQQRIRDEAEGVRRLARAILANDVEYSEEERHRVRYALENEPHTLPRVIAELHPEERGREAA